MKHPPEPISEAQRHDLALASVLFFTVSGFCMGLKSSSHKDVERSITELRSTGQIERAETYEREAKEPKNAQFIVERRRTDARIDAFVQGLALRMREFFGRELPSVLAIITNVTFDRTDLSRDRIRVILRVRNTTG